MTTRALCIGNNYEGTTARLRWCIYDAERMAEWISANAPGAVVSLRTGLAREPFVEALKEFVSSVGANDFGILTYSGHGSWQADYNGDEPDGRDETWVTEDLSHIVDDQLRKILRRADGPIVIYSDSCHSGSVSRGAMDATAYLGGEWDRRYLPPEDTCGADLPLHARIGDMRGGRSPVLLRGGCRDLEYSYEQSSDPAGGRFTTAVIATYQPGMTFAEHHAAVSKVPLPNQHPQLFGSRRMRKWPVFPT